MRKVICNSTPIIILCKIGKLDILRKMYTAVTIPLAVYREVTAKNDAIREQLSAEWIIVSEIANYEDKRMYKAKLHDGEVEVMILAQEQKADFVIIDDNAAKKTARYLDIKVTGTLGVLTKAKQMGLINDDMESILSNMKAHGFYISKKVEDMVLRETNMSSNSNA